MQLHHSHPWNVSPDEAIAIQLSLAAEVRLTDETRSVTRVAGIDVGFESDNTITRAAVAILSYPDLHLVDQAVARQPTRFPYVPGLLSFREIPAILEALEQIRPLPDLLLVDGMGIAHPRRCGIATHLGVLLDMPAIGVGKSRLVGRHDEPPETRGAWTPLIHRRETIGAVLRTRPGVKPLYISPGHRMSLQGAIDWVMRCTTRYRLPETTRWAHRLASGTEQEIQRALARGRPVPLQP